MPTDEESHTRPGCSKPDNDYLADEYSGLFFLKTVASCSRSHRLLGSLSNRRCQCSFRSKPVMSNGGEATVSWGIIDANSSATERGTVAIRSDFATMNGTLRKWGVNTTTRRLMRRRSKNRSTTS